MCIRDRAWGRFSPQSRPKKQLIRLRLRQCARRWAQPVSYTHLRAHETPEHLVCRLLIPTRVRSSAASDVYKRQSLGTFLATVPTKEATYTAPASAVRAPLGTTCLLYTSPSPTRLLSISYAVF